MKDIKQRFLAKVKKISGGCWLWQGYVLKCGYGNFSVNNKTRLAHRVSAALFKGDPAGRLVLHRCDNRACVRPSHLFFGDHQDNSDDMVSKGRQGKRHPQHGELNYASKLTQRQVDRIRKDSRPQRVIALTFQISQPAVSMIKRGQRWGK